MNIPTVFCKVIDIDGSQFDTLASEEPRIDAAVSRWVDSGCTKDTLLALDAIDGDVVKILASSVRAWYVSTPETRQRSVEIGKFFDEEHTSHRQAVGMWDTE